MVLKIRPAVVPIMVDFASNSEESARDLCPWTRRGAAFCALNPEGDLALLIEANEVEDVLADVDTDDGKGGSGGLRCAIHGTAPA